MPSGEKNSHGRMADFKFSNRHEVSANKFILKFMYLK